MTSWTSGYVADIGYTHGFYRELTPTLLSFVALTKNQHGPDMTAPLAYCELGCGQGFSMNLLAAANPHIRFYATDFNPTQIAGARRLASEAGISNVSFFDTNFTQFSKEQDLPREFDIISLHGIYSWINKKNRKSIVDFINRKLKVGGLVYISYNCMPGWSATAPMRQLMYLHAGMRGGPTAQRLEGALQFVEQIQNANGAFFRATPRLKEWFERLKGQNRNYLAHEYFNSDWNPFYHSEVARELSAAKLTYLGSTAVLEQIDAINLTAEQQQVMAGIDDPVLRETVRDFMINQQFRRDVFVKGAVPHGQRTIQERWLSQRFVLSVRPDDIELKVNSILGEAAMQKGVYCPLLEVFGEGPKTLQELLAAPKIAALGWANIQQALTVLVGMGHLQPSLPARDDGKRAKSTRAFNQAVMARAPENGDLQFLASPVSGGGHIVGRFHQLFLMSLAKGEKMPEDWAASIWKLISSQGQKLIKDGLTLETEDDNLAELRAQAADFALKQLPVLRGLQIA